MTWLMVSEGRSFSLTLLGELPGIEERISSKDWIWCKLPWKTIALLFSVKLGGIEGLRLRARHNTRSCQISFEVSHEEDS
jgi:hypothetical protein